MDSYTDRKHRVTFRVAPDLAAALRSFPNQTLFVEAALREALARTCPTCDGKGRAPQVPLAVSDFRRHRLGRLDRAGAVRLQRVVRVARRLAATHLELARTGRGLGYRVARRGELLLDGRIERG